MQHLDNVLVVGGEDEPTRQLMQQAVQELLDKHKGANSAVYGDLGYLILFATAADAVSVFALNLGQTSRLEPLIPEFVVSHAASIQHALNIEYNKVLLLGVANDQLVYDEMLTTSQVDRADGGLDGSAAHCQVVHQSDQMA